MEATVDPLPRGPDWMPITPKTGSLFHAETHPDDHPVTVVLDLMRPVGPDRRLLGPGRDTRLDETGRLPPEARSAPLHGWEMARRERLGKGGNCPASFALFLGIHRSGRC